MKTFALAILFLLHPVHVTLTGIEYDKGNRTYSVFLKIYSDDLYSDMKLLDPAIDKESSDSIARFGAYLSDRFQITENGRPLKLKIIKAESDGIEHRFTITAEGKKKVTEVRIMNRIMTRLYSDQANMVMFKFNDVEDAGKMSVTDTLRIYKVN